MSAPVAVGGLDRFVDDLLAPGPPTLGGFDLPIGLPHAYAERTGFAHFRQALAAFGTAVGWEQFFTVNGDVGGIGLRRPFYPMRAHAGVTQRAMLDALGLARIDQLRRRCERARPARRAGAPLFWTLGGNQVGKAAISAWQGVIRPALDRGAWLWPFDGALEELAARGGVTLCETYPAEAYGHVDTRFGPRRSKRRQADRIAVTMDLLARCRRLRIDPTAEAEAAIRTGFGPDAAGEDAFDAMLGLLGMIEVAEGRRAAMPGRVPDLAWEGWILGQQSADPFDGGEA